MSEESSSEEEEAQVKGVQDQDKKINNVMGSQMEASQVKSTISSSSEKEPSLTGRVEKPQNQKKDWLSKKVKEAMQDPIRVPGITAAAITTQASPSSYSAASSILKAASVATTPSSSEALLLSPRALPSSPASPARLRLVVPVSGALSRLPTNLVPCAPPPHLRMRAPMGSPMRSPRTTPSSIFAGSPRTPSCISVGSPRTPSSILVGSPGASKLVPCSPPNLRSPPVASSASLLPSSSLPSPTSTPSFSLLSAPSTSTDRVIPTANPVLQKQNAWKEEKTHQRVLSKSLGALNKTFTRRPKTGTLAGYSEPKALMGRRTGLGIDATQDKDICIDLPTLSLATFEPELPGFDTVLKLGSGATEKHVVPAVQSEEETNDREVLENSVVFHVANQAMITQPTGGDNLEVKEH